MDVLSIVGIVLAFAAILGGNFIEGGDFGVLLNAPAGIIVIGGTLGAATLHTSWRSVVRALQIFFWVFKPPNQNINKTVDKILHWSRTARKEGLLGLELIAEAEKEYFAGKGLGLLVDGIQPDAIRSAMEVDLFLREKRDLKAARFFESMGGYAPTIGIIGAVMGLIHVMRNLADPSQLGAGIATAFVSTIYGVGLANLLFLPIASKLKGVIGQQYQHHEMIIDGIIAIAEGENPRSIEIRLQGYLEHN